MTTLPLDSSLPCMHCRYDLRGQPIAGRCPECGRSVHFSVEALRSSHSVLIHAVAFHTLAMGLAPFWCILILTSLEANTPGRNPLGIGLPILLLGIAGFPLWSFLARKLFPDDPPRLPKLLFALLVVLVCLFGPLLVAKMQLQQFTESFRHLPRTIFWGGPLRPGPPPPPPPAPPAWLSPVQSAVDLLLIISIAALIIHLWLTVVRLQRWSTLRPGVRPLSRTTIWYSIMAIGLSLFAFLYSLIVLYSQWLPSGMPLTYVDLLGNTGLLLSTLAVILLLICRARPISVAWGTLLAVGLLFLFLSYCQMVNGAIVILSILAILLSALGAVQSAYALTRWARDRASPAETPPSRSLAGEA